MQFILTVFYFCQFWLFFSGTDKLLETKEAVHLDLFHAKIADQYNQLKMSFFARSTILGF